MKISLIIHFLHTQNLFNQFYIFSCESNPRHCRLYTSIALPTHFSLQRLYTRGKGHPLFYRGVSKYQMYVRIWQALSLIQLKWIWWKLYNLYLIWSIFVLNGILFPTQILFPLEQNWILTWKKNWLAETMENFHFIS